jgi:DNA-directed RNA polymerase specialized sigma24 family protein
MEDNLIIENLRSGNTRFINKTLAYWNKQHKTKALQLLKKWGILDFEAEDIYITKLHDFYQNISISNSYHYGAALFTYFVGMLKNEVKNRQRKHYLHLNYSLEESLKDLEEIQKRPRNTVYTSDWQKEKEEEWSNFKRMSLNELKSLVQHFNESIGQKCYRLLKLKYTRSIKLSYEEILKLLPDYKNVDTLKATALKCKEKARRNLAVHYKNMLQDE